MAGDAERRHHGSPLGPRSRVSRNQTSSTELCVWAQRESKSKATRDGLGNGRLVFMG